VLVAQRLRERAGAVEGDLTKTMALSTPFATDANCVRIRRRIGKRNDPLIEASSDSRLLDEA